MRSILHLFVSLVIVVSFGNLHAQLRSTDYEIWVYNHSAYDLTIYDTTYVTVWDSGLYVEENCWKGGSFDIVDDYTYDDHYRNGSIYGYCKSFEHLAQFGQ